MQEKIENIISKMTLEEKCSLLSGEFAFKTRAYEKHGIPAMLLSDGPHGLRVQAEGANHLGIGKSLASTCFPTAQAVANSWNPELGEKIGVALGEEAAAVKVGVVLGPGMNIKRSPLCGRNFEYFSEDPYLAGKMAAGYVRGIESKGISACPKHFAVNSQEMKRMSSDSIVDERTLRELYLTGFEIAVKEAHPSCIMTSYNLVNGTYANENTHLLKDVLKDEWGYDGMVVTDWGGSNDHTAGVAAGSTLEMPTPGLPPVRELINSVRTGKLAESAVDDRVREMLAVICKTDETIRNSSREIRIDDHHKLAKSIADECIVLMKNEDGILPLKADTKVAVVGDFAKTPRYQGAGSSLVNSTQEETGLECIKASALNMVSYSQGFKRHAHEAGTTEDKKLAAEALAAAKEADVVLCYIGLDEMKESEGLDRSDMRINDNQIKLLYELKQSGAKIVAVLHGGSPVETEWFSECDAVVYAALTGQAGAAAVVDVITGKVNPSGKLSETWPVSLKDTPAYDRYPARKKTAEYREGLYVGYRYFDTAGMEVSLPFGYGLTYTAFQYADLRLNDEGASFTITNTGDRAGAEVAQLYVSFEGRNRCSLHDYRPVHELKGFKKVFLNPGESREVMIPFDEYTFRRFDTKQNAFVTDPGRFTIQVGASSRDLLLTGSYEVTLERAGKAGAQDQATEGAGTAAAKVSEEIVRPYLKADIQNVSDASFEALLGYPVPENKIRISRAMTLGELGHSRAPIGWLIAGVLTLLLNKCEKKGKPNLNLLFQYNMPLRALAKMTGGAISMGMVDALVMEFKGFWIIGLIRFIFEAVKNVIQNAALARKLK